MTRLLILGTVAVLLFSSAICAQDMTGKFALSPFGGLGIPMGDMADDDVDAVLNGDAGFRKMGSKFGLMAEYSFTPSLAAGLSFRYAQFKSKDLEIPDETGETSTFESDSKMTALIFAAQGKYFFMTEGTVRPYGVLGAGLTMAKFSDVEGMLYDVEDVLDFDAVTRPFVMFGVGGDYFVAPNISLFGEATFDYFFADGTELKIDDEVYQELGTNYYFVDVLVGVTFWLGGSGE